jgi:thioredoxin reductase
MTIEKVKCLIIGTGPARYTATIYAASANMKPVLYIMFNYVALFQDRSNQHQTKKPCEHNIHKAFLLITN